MINVTVEEIIELIRNKIKEIDNTRVYVCLKTMKLKYINNKTVENVKICIAISEVKLLIMVSLYSYIKNIKETSMSQALLELHTLGDKKVITLIRDDMTDIHHCKLCWFLSESFSKLYYLNQGDIENK